MTHSQSNAYPTLPQTKIFISLRENPPEPYMGDAAGQSPGGSAAQAHTICSPTAHAAGSAWSHTADSAAAHTPGSAMAQTGRPLAQAGGQCPHCRGQGFLLINSNTVSLCACRRTQHRNELLGPALLDPAILACDFDNYPRGKNNTNKAAQKAGRTPKQYKTEAGEDTGVAAGRDLYTHMYNEAIFYARNFSLLRNTPFCSLGFLDRGDTTSKARGQGMLEMNAARQHLLAAVARHLSREGLGVLMVEDTALMSLLQQNSKKTGNRRLPQILKLLKTAEVLIWQDLGRSRVSPGSRGHYLDIFTHRRRHNLPVCFSSMATPAALQHRLGIQAASSLLSMCSAGLNHHCPPLPR